MSQLLLIGATGTTGSVLAEQMSAAGKPFRALMHSKRGTAPDALRGAKLCHGNLEDRDSLLRACAGIDGIYLAHSVHCEAGEWCRNLYRAAAEAGVQHIVRLSAINADSSSPVRLLAQHADADQALVESGLDYTLLRPNAFSQNLLAQAPVIRSTGSFYLAAGDAQQSLIDVRDIAEAALKILEDPGAHRGAVYELTGPDALSYAEVATRIGSLTGQDVHYVATPEAEAQEALQQAGLSRWQAESIAQLQADFANGNYARVSKALPELLPHPPRTVDEFLADNVAAFRPA